MATNYTTLLGFALPTTGELSGTWGTTVNDSITQLVEDSVAQRATASVASGDWTLTTTGSGAANQARCAILIPTGSPGVSRNIIAPSSSKAYIVINQSDAAVVVKGGGAGVAPSSTSLLALSAAVTTGNFVKAVGYADTVTALGNTGTAINIDITSGGVFTATLTGSCTFTLRYPVSSGASSFVLILTNDATPGRTVAWAGGSFKFPGGAASLSRTTTANAIDVWFFFTPDGGTTYYGSIPMKNLAA